MLMKKISRLFIYILINMIVSVVTTLTVLLIWDIIHSNPKNSPSLSVPVTEITETIQNSPSMEDQPAEETPPDFVEEGVNVTINAIVGAGNLSVEYVEIRNQSEGPVDLTGWQLNDENDHTFTFPALILNNHGAINVFSQIGNNTVIELFWQSEIPIWESGETASLLNASGEIMTTYTIP